MRRPSDVARGWLMPILLAIALIITQVAFMPAPAQAKGFAYQFEQNTKLYGPTQCQLQDGAAKVSATRIGLEFIYIRGSGKVQVVNLRRHVNSFLSLADWYAMGLPLFHGRPINTVPTSGHGQDVKSCGMNGIYFKGGPAKPTLFIDSKSKDDYWLYSEAIFCQDILVSKDMNAFICAAYRIGSQQGLFPLSYVAVCTKDKFVILETKSVKKLDPGSIHIEYNRAFPTVSIGEVMKSKTEDNFASELMNSTSPQAHKQ